ncbi:MAG: hypothetical protein MHM6MM_001515 [Cercozoa sp. M6MM]
MEALTPLRSSSVRLCVYGCDSRLVQHLARAEECSSLPPCVRANWQERDVEIFDLARLRRDALDVLLDDSLEPRVHSLLLVCAPPWLDEGKSVRKALKVVQKLQKQHNLVLPIVLAVSHVERLANENSSVDETCQYLQSTLFNSEDPCMQLLSKLALVAERTVFCSAVTGHHLQQVESAVLASATFPVSPLFNRTRRKRGTGVQYRISARFAAALRRIFTLHAERDGGDADTWSPRQLQQFHEQYFRQPMDEALAASLICVANKQCGDEDNTTHMTWRSFATLNLMTFVRQRSTASAWSMLLQFGYNSRVEFDAEVIRSLVPDGPLKLREAALRMLSQTYARLDRRKDGQVSLQTVQQAMHSFGEFEHTQQAVEALLPAACRTHGTVSESDFVTLFASMLECDAERTVEYLLHLGWPSHVSPLVSAFASSASASASSATSLAATYAGVAVVTACAGVAIAKHLYAGSSHTHMHSHGVVAKTPS